MAAKGKRGGQIIILVALILIFAVGAVYLWLQMQQQQSAEQLPTAEPSKQMVQIVITTQFIARGEEITEAKVMMIDYPAESYVEGTFIRDIQSVIGSRARYDLQPSVPLTKAVLIEPAGGSVASFDVPKDFVAIPIPATRLTSVDNSLAPGDHVMVIGCMSLVDVDTQFQSKLPNQIAVVERPGVAGGEQAGPERASAGIIPPAAGASEGRAQLDSTLNLPVYIVPSEPQRPRLVCQTVIQDAVVLKTGQETQPQAQPTPLPQEQPQEGVQTAPTPTGSGEPFPVTLVVSPQDAVALNYMLLSEVNLNLALRNPTDTNPIVTDAVTLQYLMDQKNIPLPAKLPYAIEPRVDQLKMPELGPTPIPVQ
ncbi:MAG: SAF domain-containing protein [Chloroflexota bacterium]